MNLSTNIVFIIILVILIIIFIFKDKLNKDLTESFSNQSGRFCLTCKGRTFNQCLSCFNCGFCVDKYGNGKCIGGDHKGPYNYENCARWYSGDPFTYMMQKNANYSCKDGPRASNRIIGV